MLLSLLTAQRGHALHLFKMTDLKMYRNKCVIHFSDKHKHTRLRVHTQPAEILQFAENRKLWPADHLGVYLKTDKLRKGPELFISVVKPHVRLSRNSFSWVKTVLKDARVDIERFGSHSTWAAAVTSTAGAETVSLKVILNAAGWTTDRTFSCFYKKTVSPNFGQMVLDKFVSSKQWTLGRMLI